MASEFLEPVDLGSQLRSRSVQRVEDFPDVGGRPPVCGPAGTPGPCLSKGGLAVHVEAETPEVTPG